MNLSSISQSWYLCLRVLRRDVNLSTLETSDLYSVTEVWKQYLIKMRGKNETTLESLKSCCFLGRKKKKKICSCQISDVIISLKHEILTVCYCAKIYRKAVWTLEILQQRFKQRKILIGMVTTRWNNTFLFRTIIQLLPTEHWGRKSLWGSHVLEQFALGCWTASILVHFPDLPG